MGRVGFLKQKKMISIVVAIVIIAAAIALATGIFKTKAGEIKSEIFKASGNYDVTIKQNSSWKQDNRYGYSYEVSYKNLKSESVDNWNMELTFPTEFKIESLWCASHKVDGNKLSVIPEEYNKKLASNQTVTYGFVCYTKDKFETKNIKLVCNGVNGILSTTSDSTSDLPDAKEESTSDLPDATVQPDNNSSDDKSKNDETLDDQSSTSKPSSQSGTPVSNHKRLSLKGTDIVDSKGKKFQLKGVSTHGIAWFKEYVNKDAFKTLRDDWGANAIRLAMYTDPGAGYTEDMHDLVDNGVKYATELGMYVIIDWHILSDGNPNTYKSNALAYFDKVSKKYKNYDNVLYEICNEPNGDVEWTRDVKPYAEDVIKTIRKNDSKSLIIVGSPTWSQDVDKVAKDPIKGQTNIMYTLHFYAATHKDDLRNKMTAAIKAGIPIMVTEFGTCDASGNGANDFESANAWISLLDNNNVSYMIWNLSNKDEASALIKPSVSKISGWSKNDLSEEGQWYLGVLKKR